MCLDLLFCHLWRSVQKPSTTVHNFVYWTVLYLLNLPLSDILRSMSRPCRSFGPVQNTVLFCSLPVLHRQDCANSKVDHHDENQTSTEQQKTFKPPCWMDNALWNRTARPRHQGRIIFLINTSHTPALDLVRNQQLNSLCRCQSFNRSHDC